MDQDVTFATNSAEFNPTVDRLSFGFGRWEESASSLAQILGNLSAELKWPGFAVVSCDAFGQRHRWIGFNRATAVDLTPQLLILVFTPVSIALRLCGYEYEPVRSPSRFRCHRTRIGTWEPRARPDHSQQQSKRKSYIWLRSHQQLQQHLELR